MKLLDHYQILVQSFKQQNKDIPITLPSLSEKLSCSIRNTKIVIRRLEEIGWIAWVPGKGRGNYSKIKLLANLDKLVIDEAMQLVGMKTIDESIAHVKSYGVSHQQQQEFIHWLFFTYSRQQQDYQSGMDQLHFPSYRPLPILDPNLVNRRSENHVMRHLYNQLIKYDEKRNEHVPELAHHWEHNDDYSEWLFHLRKGVSFHDGTELTAADVCYSFKRLQSPNSAYQWIVALMKSVTAVSPYKVKFTFQRSIPNFLHAVSSLGGSIVKNGSCDKNNLLPIGTGPFKVVENSSDKLTLEAFDPYFHTRPHLDRITMYFFPELYDNQKMLGEADDDRINFYQYPYQTATSTDFNQVTVIDRGSKVLSLNRKRGILSRDTMLREAIFHVLNPNDLIDELKGNRFTPASRMVSGEETDHSLVRDSSIGRDCLKKSNYNGEVLQLYSYTGAGNEQDAGWMKKRLHEMGINIELHILPYDQLYKLLLGEISDLLLGEQLADENIAYMYMAAFQGSHSLLSHHLAEQDKQGIATLISQNQTEKEFISSLKQVEERLCNQYGHIHIYRLKQYAIYPDYVEDIHINALGWVDYTKLWYNK
ncbi:ABC transporter substrate-binding protein [Radiobacillus sp. PE A8.2]|uniref:ABC transporter substrate-binding protein n=1 Tax=Radiobacillus sp. PE A8.2 TaxID=3380349 RepID=UPI00388E7816